MIHRLKSLKVRSLLRFVVAGAVAVGATLIVSGTANAAPDSAWDKLARCESGGNWKTNTGNGYYGGLQLSPTTWRAFGGSGMPHHASRQQQIAVAERVLASQGWKAWPSCSRKMGLRGLSAEPARVSASAPIQAARVEAAPIVKNGADYTVLAGDTLSKIAAAQSVPGGWQALFERNRDVLSNPNRLRVGQQLDLR
jgi:hypothetical protein